eukprot:gnl/TRDRNA2_/TRDRNA2_35160_c0_seq1.p1 gnl/TRDRNA2_/TRDRNA2_35160_c0~~gnl/TRDRNA2_/TRDRNA2_35160_c0_seq1.p1  ORF type:complete len:390 (-),score=50.06 gnl/TRDRNA2_/TRDRNA2_35160_c0_seq1:20-1189(-)
MANLNRGMSFAQVALIESVAQGKGRYTVSAAGQEIDWKAAEDGMLTRIQQLEDELRVNEVRVQARHRPASLAPERRPGQPLYREPVLPVHLGSAPGGNIVSVKAYADDTRDWRKLSPEAIACHISSLEGIMQSPHPQLYPTAPCRELEHRQKHDGLMAAIAVGTLQACAEGSYWAPNFGGPNAKECRNIRTPMSHLFTANSNDVATKPTSSHHGLAEISISPDVGTLDRCHELALQGPARPRVGLVRITPLGDRRGLDPALGEHLEAQLFLRTTYLHALQEMNRHIHTDALHALEAGGLVYTRDVTILRGPMEDGARWLSDAPRLDVLWVSLQRSPRVDDQGQYARISEKAQVAETVDQIFACAVAQGRHGTLDVWSMSRICKTTAENE